MSTARTHGLVGVRSALTATVLALAIASCQARGDDTPKADGKPAQPSQSVPSPTAAPPDPAPRVVTNVAAGTPDVAVDTVVTVRANGGRLTRVRLRLPGAGVIPGSLQQGRTRWRTTALLEPGMQYRLDATAVSSTGKHAAKSIAFATADLTLDEQTYPTFLPDDGAMVGVGMPAIVRFDVPVTNRASIERHLQVTSAPRVKGSWHWVNDNEVHWRPRRFWPVGATVHISANINSVDAGNGVYGQLDRSSSFTVGSSVISKVNVRTHQMRVYVNGELARTIPVTAGKPGFETRVGTKVIVERLRSKHMDAATIGIEKDDPEYYDIPDVKFAMRVTYSGEFLHAAPWSVSDQGNANVSHGCVGMSLANARWLFLQSHPGDVVRVYGADRPLEYGNGWTDWNTSFADYKTGSALS